MAPWLLVSDEEVIDSFFQTHLIDRQGRHAEVVGSAGLDFELGLAVHFRDGALDRSAPAIVEIDPVPIISAGSIEARGRRIDEGRSLEQDTVAVAGPPVDGVPPARDVDVVVA